MFSRILFFFFFLMSVAHADLCNPDQQFCPDGSGRHSSSSSSAQPTMGSSFNLNPSSVPVSRGFGVEILYFQSFDFSFVSGTGRAGAAISPTNSDNTFFGPPAYELGTDYLNREQNQTKYPSQKYTLATALNVYDNHSEGLGHKALNVGLMAKYNSLSHTVWPGTGVSGLWGPVSFAYSIYEDETVLNLAPYGGGQENIRYLVQSYSLGLMLGSVALDYSVINMANTGITITGSFDPGFTANETAFVSVATASLFYKHAIFTAAYRTENSDRPYYDPASHMLVIQALKYDTYASAQVTIGKHFLIGALYNYYLLRDVDLNLTIFL